MGDSHSDLKFIIATIIVVMATSCVAGKKHLHSGAGTINQCIENIIYDYSSSGQYRVKYDVFNISVINRDSAELYFRIAPERSKWLVITGMKIGKYSDDLPTNYKVFNGKLFIWNDDRRPINTETMDVMQRFGVLDSFYVKKDMGIINDSNIDSFDTPEYSPDATIKTTFYFFCKTDIRSFKKVQSRFRPIKTQYPNVKCK